MTRDVKAILFDKDGCLCDFGATWDAWAARQIGFFANGDAVVAQALADSLRYDLAFQRFLPDSPVIAGTNRDTAECIARVIPGWEVAALEAHVEREAALVTVAEVVPLAPFLSGLRAKGLALGVVTNDAEDVARSQMRRAGAEALFGIITGADSGHGPKPSPAPLLASAAALGVAPSQAVMVGDSTHDLEAGRAAGMRTVGVLTGLAGRAELARLADVVLPDIGHLPQWLGH